MTEMESSNLKTIREYLVALGAGVTGPDLGRFFTSDAIQIELPNLLNRGGGQSDLETLFKRSEQGKHLLASQSYRIVSEIALGVAVAVEAVWTARLSVPLGTLKPGDEMKAHFAMFFQFRDGRICSQRNYDCFEPF